MTMTMHHSGTVDRIALVQPMHARANAVVGVKWMLRVQSLDAHCACEL